MRKRLLSLVLAFVMLLGLIPAASASDMVVSGVCGGDGDGTNLKWALTDDGTLTIKGSGSMKKYTASNAAPWLGYRDDIIRVVIENGVTNIGSQAFKSCTNLDVVEIPDSVTDIGYAAFHSCTGLTTVRIPDGVTKIGNEAFRSCTNLMVVVIPDSVTKIGDEAFRHCDNLRTLNTGNGVTTIGYAAFDHCGNLSYVKLGNSVTTIGIAAFSWCASLTVVDIPDSVTTIEELAFSCCDSLYKVKVPDSVTIIGNGAFQACDNLTTVEIGNGVGIIAEDMFNHCDNLTVVKLGDKVTKIETHAFWKCIRLTTVEITDRIMVIEQSAFGNCHALSDVYYYGTKGQWDAISILLYNDDLTGATRHYMAGSYTSNGDLTHGAIYACTDCGEVRKSVTEACVDENGDLVCDLCSAAMSSAAPEPECDHSNTTSATTANSDKTHTTTVTCECGEVISTETSDCIDADKDTYCDVCDAQIVTIKKAVFAGSNMTLGNELEVNFLMVKKNLPAGDYTAVITQKMANGEERITEVAMADWGTMGTYHKISARIAAREMADNLYIEIKDAEGYVYNEEYFTSVRGYAGRALSASSTTQYVRIMMIDMLNYGAAAQANFKYKTDDLANNELTEADQALATAKVTCTDNQMKDATVYGANLSLEDSILLNTFFKGLKGKDIASMYAMVTFTDFEGKAKEIRMEGSEFEKYGSSGDIYKIVVDDVVLADARQLVTVTLYNADGTVFGTGSDSVESYVARAEANNADTYGLYANIMKFATSAYNYIVNK